MILEPEVVDGTSRRMAAFEKRRLAPARIPRRIVITAMALGLVTATAFAGEIQNQLTRYNVPWSQPSSWSRGVVPGALDDVGFTEVCNFLYDANASGTVGSMSGKALTLTLARSLAVTDLYLLEGQIYDGGFNLRVTGTLTNFAKTYPQPGGGKRWSKGGNLDVANLVLGRVSDYIFYPGDIIRTGYKAVLYQGWPDITVTQDPVNYANRLDKGLSFDNAATDAISLGRTSATDQAEITLNWDSGMTGAIDWTLRWKGNHVDELRDYYAKHQIKVVKLPSGMAFDPNNNIFFDSETCYTYVGFKGTDFGKVRLLGLHSNLPESATNCEELVKPLGRVRAVMVFVEFSDVEPAQAWKKDPRRVASHLLGEWAVVKNTSARGGLGRKEDVSLTDCKGLCYADQSCLGISYSDHRTCLLMGEPPAPAVGGSGDRWDCYFIASRAGQKYIDLARQPVGVAGGGVPLVRYDEREAQDIYTLQSLGAMSLEVDVLARWKTVGKVTDFLMPVAKPSTATSGGLDWNKYIKKAIQLWDPEIDYSLYDVVMVVAEETKLVYPSPTHFTWVATDEGTVKKEITFGSDSYENAFVNLMHEMGHVFGLPDLYPYLPLTGHFVGVWDIMGDMQWARSFLGWHRYKNSWLTENEIEHVEAEGDYRFTLKHWPEEPGEVATWRSRPGIAMVTVLPCSPETWPPQSST